MPAAIPAIVVAAGQAIAVGTITTSIIYGFVFNVALAGYSFCDPDGTLWVLDGGKSNAG
jgi:hypothetical protein